MGSSFWTVTDDDLHVVKEPGTRRWWAINRAGSYYGYASTKTAGLAIARDAAASLRCAIVVHREDGQVDERIKRVRTHPSPQFFQDAVP